MIKLVILSKCRFCGGELNYSELKLQVCQNCLTEMSKSKIRNRCDKCGLPLQIQRVECNFCKNYEVLPEKVFCVFEYSGIISKLLKEYKYNNKKEVSEIFFELLKDLELRSIFGRIDFIVSVPTSLRRILERGFDTVKSIFYPLSKKWGIPYLEILGRKSFHKSQSKLSKEERMNKIKSQFYLIESYSKLIMSKNILLVDDVFTTGSTLNTCTSILKNANVRNVFAMTICRAIEAG